MKLTGAEHGCHRHSIVSLQRKFHGPAPACCIFAPRRLLGALNVAVLATDEWCVIMWQKYQCFMMPTWPLFIWCIPLQFPTFLHHICSQLWGWPHWYEPKTMLSFTSFKPQKASQVGLPSHTSSLELSQHPLQCSRARFLHHSRCTVSWPYINR